MKKISISYKLSRYIMIGVAVVAFTGSISTAVAGILTWREQKMIEEVLASTEEIHATYQEMDLPAGKVVGIYWEEYVDAKGRYSFQFPRGWTVSTAAGTSSNMLDISSSDDAEEEDVSVIRIEVNEYSDGAPSPETVVSEDDVLREQYTSTEFAVDGQSGILLSQNESTETYGGIALVTCADDLYRIRWGSSTPEAAANSGQTMGAIIDTLIFLGDCSNSGEE